MVQENDYPLHGDTSLANQRHESVRKFDKKCRGIPTRSQITRNDTLISPFDGNDGESPVIIHPVKELLLRPLKAVRQEFGRRNRRRGSKWREQPFFERTIDRKTVGRTTKDIVVDKIKGLGRRERIRAQ